MLRRPRIDFPGAWHHVMHRGARRAPIFKQDAHCQLFLDLPRVQGLKDPESQFAYPDDKTMQEIAASAKKAKVDLHVPSRGEDKGQLTRPGTRNQ